MSQKATKPGTPEPADPTAKQVAAYLRAHPDFLLRHPNLLAVMEAPVREFAEADPDGGAVVDLQHAMVGRLRSELVRSAKQQGDLIDAGRNNQRSQARIHATVLRLLYESEALMPNGIFCNLKLTSSDFCLQKGV